MHVRAERRAAPGARERRGHGAAAAAGNAAGGRHRPLIPPLSLLLSPRGPASGVSGATTVDSIAAAVATSGALTPFTGPLSGGALRGRVVTTTRCDHKTPAHISSEVHAAAVCVDEALCVICPCLPRVKL